MDEAFWAAESAFFKEMRGRNLGEPLLVVTDGAAGIIKAIETCFPRSERLRCLTHRMRNLACKVSEELRPEFKVEARGVQQAPSKTAAGDMTESSEPSSVGYFPVRSPASSTNSRPALPFSGCQ